MVGGAQDDYFFLTSSHVVDCWVIHHPPLDFHGACGRGRRPWLCKHAPWSRTGADGPQAEERAMAADAHRIARVLCDEFLFFVFLRGSEEKTNLELWVSIFFYSRESERERTTFERFLFDIMAGREHDARQKLSPHHTTLGPE